MWLITQLLFAVYAVADSYAGQRHPLTIALLVVALASATVGVLALNSFKVIASDLRLGRPAAARLYSRAHTPALTGESLNVPRARNHRDQE